MPLPSFNAFKKAAPRRKSNEASNTSLNQDPIQQSRRSSMANSVSDNSESQERCLVSPMERRTSEPSENKAKKEKKIRSRCDSWGNLSIEDIE
eukprot:CAMPEP_0176008706 /NCGR_PEP_ID=MMETSP0120_2-20121206/3879_1 /TAXON_ID=160619 /ORGANISM="Kryptoperidinium foliaceum, Strain CCMP 1326" /LENGTH=92 /DNA_ID=CAMNT_0017341491 /DNA_START=156 /DNA_END=434 /DNA_ORIENTATION=+